MIFAGGVAWWLAGELISIPIFASFNKFKQASLDWLVRLWPHLKVFLMVQRRTRSVHILRKSARIVAVVIPCISASLERM